MASIPSCLTCHCPLLETHSVYQPPTKTFTDLTYYLREKYTPASHKNGGDAVVNLRRRFERACLFGQRDCRANDDDAK